MHVDAFMVCIRQGQIPPEAPGDLDEHGWAHPGWLVDDVQRVLYRNECNKHGMWAIVHRNLARHLATYIGDRQVLEIMAGAGWLARALSDEGIDIIATDSGEWDERHDKMHRPYAVRHLEASEAVEHYSDAGVLLVSWPPYGETPILDACERWGSDRPIIYIGEGQGGCNAPDEWWARFWHDETVSIPLSSWPGLHDHVYVGHWVDHRAE